MPSIVPAIAHAIPTRFECCRRCMIPPARELGGQRPAVAVVSCLPGMAQKLNISCRSMLRFDAGEEKNPPARAFDLPNSGDSSTPTGCARFTLLKMLRVIAEKVSE